MASSSAPKSARYMEGTKSVDPFPESRRIFHRDGNFYKEDDRFIPARPREDTHPHCGRSRSDFYRGKIAAEMADYLQKNGGLITREDLAAYEVKDRGPAHRQLSRL